MEKRTILRFRKRTIILHWVHAIAFLVLVLTGAIMFFHTVGNSAIYHLANIHNGAAVIFIVLPIVYYFIEPRTTVDFLRETFRWGKEDSKWARAAPVYYFGGSEDTMPAQDHINTGQKLWQVIVVVTGLFFVVTGIILWFFKFNVTVSTYQWVLLAHGILFVIIFAMFMLHVYLGVFHPRFKEALRAMIDGKISPNYARTHYRLWYDKKSNHDHDLARSTKNSDTDIQD